MTFAVTEIQGVLRLALLAGCCVFLPAAAQVAQQVPTAPFALTDLLATPTSIHPAWRLMGLAPSKAVALTRFQAGQVDGVNGVKLQTDGSYGTLVHEVNGPAQGRLQWRWRLDMPLAGGRASPDLLTKAGDDAALKVCVLFDHPLARVPWTERAALRLARVFTGQSLPAATVCYVWDSTYSAGTTGANPYTRRVRFITLQGRAAPLSRWVAESLDVAQDFQALFADELPPANPAEPPRVQAVLIGADSDNTGGKSTGWVADLQWGVAP